MKHTLIRSLYAVLLIALILAALGPIRPAYAAGYTVNSLNDVNDGSCNASHCSLREAINAANSTLDNDTITFSVSGTIYLGSTLPNIVTAATAGTLTIDGGGNITISGDSDNSGFGNVRVMVVNAGADFTLQNLTITRGMNNAGYGGGVDNLGTLTIINSTFSENWAYSSGGGVLNEGGGTLTIINSTFSGNFSNGGGGGGVYNVGTLTIINSTFNSNQVGNTSGGSDGGGVYNHSFGTLTITNSTFNNNYVLNTGGGVFNAGVATIKNTIIANSTNGDCYGTLTSANNNLIEGNGHACGLTDGVNGNIIGSDPNLGSLTGSPGYFPLNPGSLAIDAGDDAACAAAPVNNQSQNGVTRPQGAHCDIGSYEAADTTAPTVSSIVRQLPADQVVTSGSSVTFRVTFSEGVSGVDTSDFTLTLLSVPGTNASISGVTPLSASVYDVTVDISGLRNSKNKLDGALRLDVSASASITDLASNALSGLPFTGGQVYSIVQEQTFSDVATSHWAWTYIERLFYMGITGGCTTSNYCPNNVVTRAQTAIFLLRGIHGASYTPPSASGTIFNDVTTSTPGAAWIEQLYAEGITSGCGGGNYCPNSSVTRAQMAIFLLRAKYGASYTPPPATGTVFSDVTTSTPGAAWIEQLYAEGITSGCGGGKYCPSAAVTRVEMAVFLVRTFNLP